MPSASTDRSSNRRFLLAALACVLSCGGAADEGSTVHTVVITAPTGVLSLQTLGRQLQFTAEARDAAGSVIPGATIQWFSSDPGSITSTGLFTALHAGPVTVRAVADRVSSTPMTVTIAPLAVSVTIAPDSLTFHSTGFAQSLVIEARDSSGALLTEGVTWAVADTKVARSSGPQTVFAVADGTTWIVATAGGATDTAHVVVSLVPASIGAPSLTFTSHTARTLSPLVKDSASHVIPGYPVHFACDDSSVVVVDPQGLVTPGAEGRTLVRVSAGPVSVAAPVAVQYVLASVQILPSHMTFYTAGRPQHAELYAFDSTGVNIGPLPDSAAGRPGSVAWAPLGWYFSIVPSGTGVDVYPEYQFDYDLVIGTFNSGLSGYALVSVWWYPATFGLTAPQTTLTVGDSAIITGFALDSLGNDLFQRAPYFWLSTDQSVADLVSDFGIHEGVVHGLAPGTTWIHMFGSGREDSVLVTVH